MFLTLQGHTPTHPSHLGRESCGLKQPVLSAPRRSWGFMEKWSKNMTIAYHTLGCKVNQYDTEAMRELLEAAGYSTVPFSGSADIFLIKTC